MTSLKQKLYNGSEVSEIETEVTDIFTVDLDYIRETRLKKGYSLQKMVNLMGILDKTKYYRREIGEVSFKPEELPVVVLVLEIPLESLFKREGFEKGDTCSMKNIK